MLFWFVLTSFVSLIVGAAIMRCFGMTIIKEQRSPAVHVGCTRCSSPWRSMYCAPCTVALHELEQREQQSQQLDDVTSVDWSIRQPPASVVSTEGESKHAIS